MFDWNDLKYFLAVARHGSTTAAAKATGVNQSTVQRRIVELERRIGQSLIHRHASGYQLTEFGQLLLPKAEELQQAALAIERQTRLYVSELSGVVRLTCPEPLVSRINGSQLLEQFHLKYPEIRIEFVMSDGYLDLSKGEADVALRSGEPSDENLVGKKIADSIWAVYASRSYVQRHGTPGNPADIDRHAIVGFDGALANHRAAKWFASVAPTAKFGARNNSVLGVLHAVKSGLGLALLPTTIAEMHDDLVQVLPPVEELNRGWYLLAHPDIRKTPRVRAFFEFVSSHNSLVRPILMG
ncbi:LysR family transcriptional regulator [Rhizobium leguminosarum]|uniref:LysR family transcriptional regulator n=1 Tax=Rhizobium leguminosarum TaxID=384 RepID=UPI003ED0CB57